MDVAEMVVLTISYHFTQPLPATDLQLSAPSSHPVYTWLFMVVLEIAIDRSPFRCRFRVLT